MRYVYSIYNIGLIGFFLFGCAPESRYGGGLGSFKDYESLGSYQNKDVKYSPKYTQTQTSNFHTSLVESDNRSAKQSDTKQQAIVKTNKGSKAGGERQQDIQAATYTPPVAGSGHFQPTRSLLEGMRESEAIQRATMRPYTIRGKTYRPHPVKVGDTFDGIASWYGPDFHAKATSNGETYNMHAHTAAHKTLPMNTIVSVFNKDNGKSTVVRINDRGPFVEGRIIDLSNVAARDIQMVGKGVANVRIEVVGFGGDLQNNNPKSATKITQDSKKSPATPKATISVAQDSQVDSHVSSSKPESQRILASDEIKSQPPEPIQLSTPPESLSSNTSLGAADSNANRLYSDNSTETKQQVSSQTKTKGSNLDSHKLEVIEDTLDEPIVSMVLPNQNPHLVKSAPLAQNSHSNQLTQRDVSNNSDTPVADSKNIPINKEEQKQEATQAVQNENANNDSFEPIMSDIDNTIQKLKDSTNHLQMQQNKAESHKPQSESEFQDSPKEMSNLLESEIQKPLATQDMSKDTPINNSKAQSAPDTSSTDNLGNTKKQKGRYMISLNVFSQEERAKRFRDEIYAKFQNTSYDVDVIKTDKGLYRVALRGFQNSDEARAFINSKAIVGHIVAE